MDEELTRWQRRLKRHNNEAFGDSSIPYGVYVGIMRSPSAPFEQDEADLDDSFDEDEDPWEDSESPTVANFTVVITSNSDKKRVGHISGYLIDRSGAGGDLPEDLDAEAQELVDLLYDLLDASGTSLAPRHRKGPVWSGGCDGGTMAYVIDCALMPEHRGRGALQMLWPIWQRVFQTYRVKHCVAAFLPWKSPESFRFRETDAGSDTARRVQAKLAEHFKGLGFRRFGRSTYYGCVVGDALHPCWSPNTHVPVDIGFTFTPDIVAAIQTRGVMDGIRRMAEAHMRRARASTGPETDGDQRRRYDVLQGDIAAAITVLVSKASVAMMTALPRTEAHIKYDIHAPQPIELLKDVLGGGLPEQLDPAARQAIEVLRGRIFEELNAETEEERNEKFLACFPEIAARLPLPR